MPIVGNLSEFPLPEVLLLIGARTGRLRLLDVPEFGIMDIDFSNGAVEAMHMAATTYVESKDMIAKLSSVVEMQTGMFEFRLQPVASVSRSQPLSVNELVMTLVCYVDEQLAQQGRAASVTHRFILTEPQPDIWIEPELDAFYLTARQFLTAPGIHIHDLSRLLGLDMTTTTNNLTNLRLLGLVRSIDEEEAVQITETNVKDNISRKSNEFLRASRAINELQKITAALPKLQVATGS